MKYFKYVFIFSILLIGIFGLFSFTIKADTPNPQSIVTEKNGIENPTIWWDLNDDGYAYFAGDDSDLGNGLLGQVDTVYLLGYSGYRYLQFYSSTHGVMIAFDLYDDISGLFFELVRETANYVYVYFAYTIDNGATDVFITMPMPANTHLRIKNDYDTVSTEVAYAAGHETGYDEGYNVGHDEGFDLGNSTGYDEGYNVGHDEGFYLGNSTGYDLGQQDIYNWGSFAYGLDPAHSFDYTSAYEKGLNIGADFTPLTFISTFFFGIGYLFSIELIPSISIGTIALMVLAIQLLPFIIGLFTGGKKK